MSKVFLISVWFSNVKQVLNTQSNQESVWFNVSLFQDIYLKKNITKVSW